MMTVWDCLWLCTEWWSYAIDKRWKGEKQDKLVE